MEVDEEHEDLGDDVDDSDGWCRGVDDQTEGATGVGIRGARRIRQIARRCDPSDTIGRADNEFLERRLQGRNPLIGIGVLGRRLDERSDAERNDRTERASAERVVLLSVCPLRPTTGRAPLSRNSARWGARHTPSTQTGLGPRPDSGPRSHAHSHRSGRCTYDERSAPIRKLQGPGLGPIAASTRPTESRQGPERRRPVRRDESERRDRIHCRRSS